MVVSDLIFRVCDIIGDASQTPLLDARMIVMKVTGYDSVHLITNKSQKIPDCTVASALEMAELRRKQVPMAYIVGNREFMSLDFKVKSGVLIPRPDTECIAEEAIKLVSGGKILDIGTGSGALAVSLAYYINWADVTAIDISDIALETALENARSNGVNVRFIKADIFSFSTDQKFDLIISNPPYIKSKALDMLMNDVRNYEPHLALDGGEDGLDFYRHITKFASGHLNQGGYLIYEFGHDQHDAVKRITEEEGFEFVGTIYDLAGIRRGCTVKNIIKEIY